MKIFKKEITLKNILYYLQGNIRYRLFYSDMYFLIPLHIREQIDARINSMDRICYKEGQCKMCGCQTTKLQMSNKACHKPCYPPMLNKIEWEFVKETGGYRDNIYNVTWLLDKKTNVFIIKKTIVKNNSLNNKTVKVAVKKLLKKKNELAK